MGTETRTPDSQCTGLERTGARRVTVLVDRLGAEWASVVIERAGGRRLAVPADLSQYRTTDRLKRMLGTSLATLVVLHFGGQIIYIPRGAASRAPKLSTVVRMTRAGKSAASIARKLGCSDRTIYARRAQARGLGLLPGRPAE